MPLISEGFQDAGLLVFMSVSLLLDIGTDTLDGWLGVDGGWLKR